MLGELEARWWEEAEANHVLPLCDRFAARAAALEPPLWPTPKRAVFVPGAGPVADEAVPSLARGALLLADVDVPDAGSGVVLVDGVAWGASRLPRGVSSAGVQYGGGGLRLGHDSGLPVSDDYHPPFRWTGALHSVSIDGALPRPSTWTPSWRPCSAGSDDAVNP